MINERLLELVKKAGVSTTDHGRGLFVDDAVSLDDLERFAELIVRECARLDFKATGEVTTIGEIAVSNLILKHFGVEE